MGGRVLEVLCFGDNIDMVSESLTLRCHPGYVTGALHVLWLAVKQSRPRGRFGDPQGLLLPWVDPSWGASFWEYPCHGVSTLGCLLGCTPHFGVSRPPEPPLFVPPQQMPRGHLRWLHLPFPVGDGGGMSPLLQLPPPPHCWRLYWRCSGTALCSGLGCGFHSP